ncbi:head-tail adaptor protein [Comamonas sp.]|uniref:head-tail adaptor protein n=1 Tax=Comamonas sp. TaxID=34028 RepID=UPI003D098818
MHSQELDKLISFEHLVVTKDSSGGMKQNWLPLYPRVFARVSHESGSVGDATTQGGSVSTAITKFRVHAREGLVDPVSLRIKFKDKLYQVTHINPIFERGEWLMITATTGKNHG